VSTPASPALRRQDGIRPSAIKRRYWRPGPVLKTGLSAEREIELAQIIQTGSPEARLGARNELVDGNLALAEWIVYRRFADYACPGLDIDDMVQEARVGLMTAADRFDPIGHGTRFITYAVYWMGQKVRRAIQEKAQLIRIPSHRYSSGKGYSDQKQFVPLKDEIVADGEPFDEVIRADELRQLYALLRDLAPRDAFFVWCFLANHSRPKGSPNSHRRVMHDQAVAILQRLRTQAEEGTRNGKQ
jgi:RNA polymerase sigma factor (sigma-70 family)